ncbi:MAG: aminotransferase V, partial [Gemmatimonas sp.]|nr:aminotransferase V [Gemmatimonas sp.]
MERRQFLSGLAAAGVTLPAFRANAMEQLFKANVMAGDRSPAALADDELYWAQIQRAFDADR